jgi:prophage antirepressor-like protein
MEEEGMVQMENNGLQIFSFEEKQVRVVEKGGEPWWVAKDVCEVLDMGTEQIRRLDDDEKGLLKTQTPGGMQEMSIINESGLYTLIVRSNKPEAQKFRKWVTSEVLPSIRKTGAYSVNDTAQVSEREKRDVQRRRADAMLNNSRLRIAKFVRETVKDVWDYLSPEAKPAYSVYVTETATGQPGLIPLPVIEKTYTATELGSEFGITSNMLGRIANKYGLKTSEYGIEVLDKAKGHDKQVPSFRYNERGREKLAHIITQGGLPQAMQ